MDKIVAILCDVFRLKEDEMRDDLTMENIGRWDSFTHMDLIASLESELNIHFGMDEIMSMKDIKTIKDIAIKKL